MARKYADKGIASVFLYTREAHPGQNFPAHRSMEQKISHARAFKEIPGIQRPILVDDLVGTGHRLFGMLPNMIYLISRSGQILFRADWTDPPTVQSVLDYVLRARERRREGLRLAPFYAELIGYRWSDQKQADDVLWRAGQQAVDDMDKAFKNRDSAGTAPGRIHLEG